LELNGNEVGDSEIILLSEALINNHTLKVLNLSNNNIGNKGLKAIALSLFYNNSTQQFK